MASVVFSAAKRSSGLRPSLMHKGSQHFLCRFSSSSLLNTLNRESISGVKYIKDSQGGREFKDHLAKLNDKSKEVERKIIHMWDGLIDGSAEAGYLVRTFDKSEELSCGVRNPMLYYEDCESKLYDGTKKLQRRMIDIELSIAKECAEFEKFREGLLDDYVKLVVIKLTARGLAYALVFGIFYKAGQLLKPADVSTS